MSEHRPGHEPGVYTMPPEAFHVGSVPVPHPEPERATGGDDGRTPNAGPAPSVVSEGSASASRATTRPRRTWDLVLTIVLLLAAAALAAAGSVMSLFLAFLADGCGAASCDYDRMNLGLWIALSGPWVMWVVALAVSIVLLVVRRLAFWVSIVGMVLIVGVWVFGAWVASTGVG